MTPGIPKALQERLQAAESYVRNGPIGQFLSWWGSELATLLPASWRAQLHHASRRLLYRVSEEELEISVQEGDDIRVLEVYQLEQDADLQGQQIRDLLLEHELAEAPRVLLLDANDVLNHSIVLPLAAEANLRQALAFDMDRQTPFRVEDVYFDYRVIERAKETAQIRVDAVVVPKAAMDAAAETLERRGLPPSRVDVWLDAEPAGYNLLPAERRVRVPNRQNQFNWALAGGCALMVALVMWQSLAWRQGQVESLEAEIEAVRSEAMRVRRIREQIADATEAAGFMASRRAELMPVVAVLAELTDVLPDDTYLERLNIASGELQMQGKSGDAQRLIELVNEAPNLNNAAFRGPTRLDSRSGKEIFDLNAAVGTTEESDAAGP